jgi:hypothetical protein
VTNSQTESSPNPEVETNGRDWHPVRPPPRGASIEIKTAFHAYMLMPGFSVSFHAETLGRCRTSIATYRTQAKQAALLNPRVNDLVYATLLGLRPEHGLQMAQSRGTAQLPHWSLLAIAEFRDRGISRRELAIMFRCAPGTIANALQWKNSSYVPSSGERRLSEAQKNPPARISPRKA